MYRIDGVLGEGGMSIVYRATEITINHPVVIKAIRPEYTHREDYRARIIDEGRAVAKIDDHNVVQMRSVFAQGADIFLVLQYVDGESLDKTLRRYAERRQFMPLDKVIAIFEQILQGVGAAHAKGVIHRDLKPANIMIQSDDSRAKVMDFGISKAQYDERAAAEMTIGIIGSPLYISPEQINAEPDIDTRTDIYSLGIMLFEMLAGRVPFDAPTDYETMTLHISSPVPSIRAFRPDVPVHVEDVIYKACAKARGARFASTAEMARALREGVVVGQDRTVFGNGPSFQPGPISGPNNSMLGLSGPQFGGGMGGPMVGVGPVIPPVPGGGSRNAGSRNTVLVVVAVCVAVGVALIVVIAIVIVFAARGRSTSQAKDPTSIAAGEHFTCGVTKSGSVKCWGENKNGELGNNATTSSLIPTPVVGLPSDIVGISAAESEACALSASGTIRCWGAHAKDGPFDKSSIGQPNQDYVAVSVGPSHACAINSVGAAKCWGANYDGRLGINSTTRQSAPTQVSNMESGVTAISAGRNHTCAVKSGAALCWGGNPKGGLGVGDTTDRLVPTNVAGLSSGITAISAGYNFTCAVKSSGELLCWGYNSKGQLGDNSQTDRHTPTPVSGLGTHRISTVSASFFHTCALTTTGTALCWGDNTLGRLGDNTTTQRLLPTPVVAQPGANFTRISASTWHTCAITSSGEANCWGWNTSGELGNNSTESRKIPTPAIGFP